MESIISSGRSAGATLIAFMTLLDVLDRWNLEHIEESANEPRYILTVKIEKHDHVFHEPTLMRLMDALGKWLSSLPKDIWRGKMKVQN